MNLLAFSVTSEKLPNANQRYALDQFCFCKIKLQTFTRNKCFPFYEVFKYLPRGYMKGSTILTANKTF